MKTRNLFLLLSLLALSATAQTLTTVTIPFRDPAGRTIPNALILSNTATPSLYGGIVTVGVPVRVTPDSEGVATANLIPGDYRVSVQGTPQWWTIRIPETNEVVDASTVIVTGTNRAGIVAWSTEASDARYALKGATSGITNGQSDVSLTGTFSGDGAGLTNVALPSPLVVPTNSRVVFDASGEAYDEDSDLYFWTNRPVTLVGEWSVDNREGRLTISGGDVIFERRLIGDGRWLTNVPVSVVIDTNYEASATFDANNIFGRLFAYRSTNIVGALYSSSVGLESFASDGVSMWSGASSYYLKTQNSTNVSASAGGSLLALEVERGTNLLFSANRSALVGRPASPGNVKLQAEGSVVVASTLRNYTNAFYDCVAVVGGGNRASEMRFDGFFGDGSALTNRYLLVRTNDTPPLIPTGYGALWNSNTILHWTGSALVASNVQANATQLSTNSAAPALVPGNAALWNSNTILRWTGSALVASNVQANATQLRTNATPPALVPGHGALWNSNGVLHWVTTTTTNRLAPP